MKANRLISGAGFLGFGLVAAVWVNAVCRRAHAHAYAFAGRAVVITGGSRGLGLVLARMLVDEGARVTLIARDATELARARQDLIARGAAEDQVLVIPADVRNPQSIQTAVAQAVEAFDGVDVLINAAGIISVGPIQHMGVHDYEDAMATHFWGALYASIAALPVMRKQGHGRIVNIASLAGKIALPHMGPYSASKAALVSLSESMRSELAMENIKVTVVCPGPMRTGAHMNAYYKGRHQAEFAGLSLLSSLPLISTDTRAAARDIIDGCRNGKAAVVIPSLFGALPALNNLAPELVGQVLRIVNQVEPAPTTREGDVLKEGWECLSPLAPSVLTASADRATAENNGLRRHALLRGHRRRQNFKRKRMTQQPPAHFTISPQEALSLQADPRTTFVDVRSPSDFTARHIVGAINVPVSRLEEDAQLLSKDRPVIIYCAISDDENSLSRHVVQLLRARGYNAFALAGGLDAWIALGFAVVSGV
jgi:NAD(P)-dependent dehydrogenase (short-subunit alcohol dehydrogenase family)/rhodanese-related sulfurtransferase